MVSQKIGSYEEVPTKDEKDAEPVKLKKFGLRHTQMVVLFLCLSTAYLIRSQLSVSIVAMTTFTEDMKKCDENPKSNVTSETNIGKNIIGENGSLILDKNENENKKNFGTEKCATANKTGSWSVYRSYSWNKSTQEMIMFSFFAGYTTMMVPSGLLVQKYGGKKPILIALFFNGVLSILTPWMAVLGGWLAVCLCRLFQGFSQACFYPSIHCMLARWAPISERGRLSSYVYSGVQIGTIMAFQVAGFLASSSSLGWPSTFWFCGILCFICFGLLLWFGAASPHEHPNISHEELAYITGNSSLEVPRKRKIPYKAIMRSKGVWGIIIGQIGSAISFLFVLTQTPRYVDKVLGVDIKRNGIYSSLPFVALYIGVLFCGFMSDFLKTNGYLSIANIRKLFTSIGMLGSTAFLVWFGYTSSVPLAVTLLVICQGLHAGVYVGFHINHIDITPNFAAATMAIANMFANLGGLTVPVIVSYVVGDDQSNPQKWQWVMLIMFGIVLVANIMYVILAQGEVQPWNYDEEDIEYELTDRLRVARTSIVAEINH